MSQPDEVSLGLEAARALQIRAALLTAVGRHAEAIPLLTQALASDPQDSDIRCDLALALMNIGQIDQADREAYQAIASTPDHERSYRVRSIILRARGRAEDAVAMAREAVRLEPESPWAHQVLSQGCYAAKRFPEAWVEALKVVELAPESAFSHQCVGQAAIGMKNWATAERASLEALRLDPNDWAAMNNLGVALHRQGRRKEAAHAYDAAAQMNPSAETPRKNLIRVARPGHEGQYLIDVLLIVALPLLAPIIFVRWIYRWSTAIRTRSVLSSGARRYYRSESIVGVFLRLQPVAFGIVVGFCSIVVWWIVSEIAFEATGGSPDMQLLLVVALAIVTGVATAWLRTRASP